IRTEEPMVAGGQSQSTSHLTQQAMAQAPLRYVERLARPLLRRMKGNCQPAWVYDVLSAQIKRYRPDVVLNQDMALDGSFFSEMRPHIRFLVGQHAATRLSASKDWSYYDLIISSFLPTVEFFRQRGVPSDLHRLGFDPKLLSCL